MTIEEIILQLDEVPELDPNYYVLEIPKGWARVYSYLKAISMIKRMSGSKPAKYFKIRMF